MVYLVQHYSDLTCQRYPSKTAVTCSGIDLSYGELYRSSNRLANSLLANGVSRQDRIALLQGRSVEILIGIMGVLKADAIYVPIDHRSPPKRIEKVLKDCSPSAMICDGETAAKGIQLLSGEGRTKIFVLEERNRLPLSPGKNAICQEQIEEQPGDCPNYKNIDHDIASILYTSGSTGAPKGVMVSHRNILNYIEWAVDCFGIGETDKILNTAPFHFDMSTFDLYCSLKTGAPLCITPGPLLSFPGEFLAMMKKEGITIWKGVSSLLMYIAQKVSLKEKQLPALKKILFGGESLPVKYLIDWMEAFPDKEFYNVYGPTEATGISTFHRVRDLPRDRSQRIPIGRACANTEVFLLREDLSRADMGEAGELCIRGMGVSRGYWNDEAKTEERFIANPLTKLPEDRIYRTGDIAILREDGNLEFLGRKDDQVKLMGYRIDLGEIESAILSMKGVKESAAVLTSSEEGGGNGIVAFAATEDGSLPPGILQALSQQLPRYMIPQRVIAVTHIPRTERGKVDRRALMDRWIEASSSIGSGFIAPPPINPSIETR